MKKIIAAVLAAACLAQTGCTALMASHVRAAQTAYPEEYGYCGTDAAVIKIEGYDQFVGGPSGSVNFFSLYDWAHGAPVKMFASNLADIGGIWGLRNAIDNRNLITGAAKGSTQTTVTPAPPTPTASQSVSGGGSSIDVNGNGNTIEISQPAPSTTTTPPATTTAARRRR